jgi:hypothetical protein
MKAYYLRDGDHVFENYWTTGCELMSDSCGMLDMIVYSHQEPWEGLEDTPGGWLQRYRSDGDQPCQLRTKKAQISERPIPRSPIPPNGRRGLAGRHHDDLGSTTPLPLRNYEDYCFS